MHVIKKSNKHLVTVAPEAAVAAAAAALWPGKQDSSGNLNERGRGRKKFRI